MIEAALAKLAGLRPRHAGRPLPRLRGAARRARRQPGPPGRRPARAGTACRPPPSTGSAPPACRPRGWPSTRSGRARATRSSPPASSACRATGASARPASIRADTQNPLFAAAGARTAAYAETNEPWHDPRLDGELPDIYIAMGQTAENVATAYGISRAEQDEFGVRSQNLRREGDRRRGLRARDRAGHPARRHGGRHRRRTAARHDAGGASRPSSRSSAPTAPSPPATAAR